MIDQQNGDWPEAEERSGFVFTPSNRVLGKGWRNSQRVKSVILDLRASLRRRSSSPQW